MDDDARAARAERARRRAQWAGALLQDQTPAQLPTPEGRLMSMWQLALDIFGDVPAPGSDRREWPGRLIRT